MAILKETNSYMVCIDCYVLIITGDASHLDYYYDEVEADQKLSDIRTGMAFMSADGRLHDGGSRNEFSKSPCDCCDSPLHGERREIKAFAYSD